MTGEGTLATVLTGHARWTVICGDNADVLPALPDASVDHVEQHADLAVDLIAEVKRLRAENEALRAEAGWRAA